MSKDVVPEPMLKKKSFLQKLGPNQRIKHLCTYVSLILAFRNKFKFVLAVHRTPHAQGSGGDTSCVL